MRNTIKFYTVRDLSRKHGSHFFDREHRSRYYEYAWRFGDGFLFLYSDLPDRYEGHPAHPKNWKIGITDSRGHVLPSEEPWETFSEAFARAKKMRREHNEHNN